MFRFVHSKTRGAFRGAATAAVAILATVGTVWDGSAQDEPVHPLHTAAAFSDSAVDSYTLISEPISSDYFPCSDCHDPSDEVNTTPRVLTEEHEDKVLVHGESTIWCLDCHDPKERDHLHAASGGAIPFGQSHKLCGQCHGRMYQEWKRGVHGKRIGDWSGPQEYYVCVMCHNPHSPHFKPIEPLPPPVRTEDYGKDLP